MLNINIMYMELYHTYSVINYVGVINISVCRLLVSNGLVFIKLKLYRFIFQTRKTGHVSLD
jgi:hypothetical protein